MSDSTLPPVVLTPDKNPFTGCKFLRSVTQLKQLPNDQQPEVAFSGRSNSGKSSALNALCDTRHLARVSRTPGRTQLINLFEIRGGGRLIDLPGYGYAQVPETIRRGWAALVGGYIERRSNLRALIVIMDVRRPLTPLDQQMLDWAETCRTPVHILLTKVDKVTNNFGRKQLSEVRNALATRGETISVQLFSAREKFGIDCARATVAAHLRIAY